MVCCQPFEETNHKFSQSLILVSFTLHPHYKLSPRIQLPIFLRLSSKTNNHFLQDSETHHHPSLSSPPPTPFSGSFVRHLNATSTSLPSTSRRPQRTFTHRSIDPSASPSSHSRRKRWAPFHYLFAPCSFTSDLYVSARRH